MTWNTVFWWRAGTDPSATSKEVGLQPRYQSVLWGRISIISRSGSLSVRNYGIWLLDQIINMLSPCYLNRGMTTAKVYYSVLQVRWLPDLGHYQSRSMVSVFQNWSLTSKITKEYCGYRSVRIPVMRLPDPDLLSEHEHRILGYSGTGPIRYLNTPFNRPSGSESLESKIWILITFRANSRSLSISKAHSEPENISSTDFCRPARYCLM